MAEDGGCTDGVTQGTPSAGTHTLHPRPIEGQHGIDHREEDQDLVRASTSDSCDDETGSSPGGEYLG